MQLQQLSIPHEHGLSGKKLLAQYDITGAYLESELHDIAYMEVPPDMRGPNGEPFRDAQGRVCQLKRGLCGLKLAGFLWNSCFKEFLFNSTNTRQFKSSLKNSTSSQRQRDHFRSPHP